MSKNKKESFFWTSYSDLMTSLFFIMLVLFILTVALLHKQMVRIEKEKNATKEELKKITELQEATKKLDPRYFDYSETYKKHILTIDVHFLTGSSSINDLDNKTKNQLIEAGESILNTINEVSKNNPKAQYLLVIEGQASKDGYYLNDELSYKRALALKHFWNDNGTNYNCEIIVAGSGTEGILRHKENKKNQRFLIHIIPKPGNFNSKQTK